MNRVRAVALILLAAAAPAAAQTSVPAKPAARPAQTTVRVKPPARLFIGVSGGIQTPPAAFDDAFDFPLYTETGHATVDYPSKVGGLIAASVSYRLWRQFVVGVGATRSSSSGDAKVTAELPHPLIDNTFRSIEGTADTTRDETGTHLMLGLVWPKSGRFRALLTAGPSWLRVKQPIVTDVTFSETYPYDTAEFTGVKKAGGTETATGFNAGADVSWMFSRSVGVGGMVQYTHARVKANAGADRTVSFDAGGAQIGGGIRFAF
jgi:hypothetical protein